MKGFGARRTVAVCVGIPALVLLLTFPAPCAQQATPPPPPRPKRPSPSNQPASPPTPNRNMESVNQRAMDLEMLSTAGRRESSAESSNKRLANQFIEDFDRLGKIDTEVLAPMSVAGSIDYTKLSQIAAEIKNRATRIKHALANFIESQKNVKNECAAEPANLGFFIPELDRVMKSFIDNPVFRVNSPNDAELRTAAGRDLEAIINLSEVVNKVAKSLSKSAKAGK